MDAARARTDRVKRRRSVQRELVADHFISRQKTGTASLTECPDSIALLIESD